MCNEIVCSANFAYNFASKLWLPTLGANQLALWPFNVFPRTPNYNASRQWRPIFICGMNSEYLLIHWNNQRNKENTNLSWPKFSVSRCWVLPNDCRWSVYLTYWYVFISQRRSLLQGPLTQQVGQWNRLPASWYVYYEYVPLGYLIVWNG